MHLHWNLTVFPKRPWCDNIRRPVLMIFFFFFYELCNESAGKLTGNNDKRCIKVVHYFSITHLKKKKKNKQQK